MQLFTISHLYCLFIFASYIVFKLPSHGSAIALFPEAKMTGNHMKNYFFGNNLQNKPDRHRSKSD